LVEIGGATRSAYYRRNIGVVFAGLQLLPPPDLLRQRRLSRLSGDAAPGRQGDPLARSPTSLRLTGLSTKLHNYQPTTVVVEQAAGVSVARGVRQATLRCCWPTTDRNVSTLSHVAGDQQLSVLVKNHTRAGTTRCAWSPRTTHTLSTVCAGRVIGAGRAADHPRPSQGRAFTPSASIPPTSSPTGRRAYAPTRVQRDARDRLPQLLVHRSSSSPFRSLDSVADRRLAASSEPDVAIGTLRPLRPGQPASSAAARGANLLTERRTMGGGGVWGT